MTDAQSSIANIQEASRMLSLAHDLPDILTIRDISAAAVEYAKAAKLGLETQNKAAEIKIRAERKAGELLSQLERKDYNRGNQHMAISEPGNSQSPYKETLEDAAVTYQDANRYQKVASIPNDIFENFVRTVQDNGDELTTNKALKVASKIPDMSSVNGRDLSSMMSSVSNEWYTTPDIIEAVTAVMLGIDLDPCSNSRENPSVPASHHYTMADDGLSQKWFGRVYMNPPYGNEIPKWVNKIVSEYQCGNISQGIVLLPSRTDTRWFRALKPFPRCFMWGRVKFNGHENSAPFPTMLVNVGCDSEKFNRIMSKIGDIYYAI